MRKLIYATGIVVGFALCATGSRAATPPDDAATLRAKAIELANPLVSRAERADQLRDDIAQLKAASADSAGTLERARKTAEVARLAVREYEEGTLPAEIQSAEADRKLSETELERANDRYAYAIRMIKQGGLSESQEVAERMNVERAKIQVSNANTRRRVLDQYSAPKQRKQLQDHLAKLEQEHERAEADDRSFADRIAAAERRLGETRLAPDERQALQDINEALKLLERDETQTAEPERLLDQAAELIESARAERLRVDARVLRERIGEVLEQSGTGETEVAK